MLTVVEKAAPKQEGTISTIPAHIMDSLQRGYLPIRCSKNGDNDCKIPTIRRPMDATS